MLRKIIGILVVLALFLLVACDTNAVNNSVTIANSGNNRYKAVRITPEIHNYANRDLSDLRIKDSAGEYVPYFIRVGGKSESETVGQQFSMSLINAYTKDDNFYFDYVVTDIPQHDIIATSIKLSTSYSGFAKNISVYGSYDNTNWEFVKNDSLFSVDGKAKLNIEFDKIQKYTHYRFRLNNNLEKITFDSVTLNYSFVTQERFYFIEEIHPVYTIEEKDNLTHINIEGLKNLRLAEIIIDTDSMFQRNASALGVRKELYNLFFNEASYTDTSLTFKQQVSNDDILLMIIQNGDDKPININGIIVRYYADELVFEDRGCDNYTLLFGADGSIKAPDYDIVRYMEEIIKGEIDQLRITDVFLVESGGSREQYDFTLIFNIAVIIVAVILGVVIVLKLKKK